MRQPGSLAGDPAGDLAAVVLGRPDRPAKAGFLEHQGIVHHAHPEDVFHGLTDPLPGLPILLTLGRDPVIAAGIRAIGRVTRIVDELAFFLARRALVRRCISLERIPAIAAFPTGHGSFLLFIAAAVPAFGPHHRYFLIFLSSPTSRRICPISSRMILSIRFFPYFSGTISFMPR